MPGPRPVGHRPGRVSPCRCRGCVERRFARGRQFEAEVVARLRRPSSGGARHRRRGPGRAGGSDARRDAGAGCRSSSGGRLPADLGGPAGGRTRPAGSRGGRLRLPARGHQAPPLPRCRSWRPAGASVRRWTAWSGRRREQMPGCLGPQAHKDDLLQLAHYQRMLEAAGMAAPGRPPAAASSASRASSPGTTWTPASG